MLKEIACLSVLLSAVAHAQTIIPEEIAAPNGQQHALLLHAKGTQMYQCVSNQGATAWQWQRPEAQLLDEQGNLVGSHGAGPEWTHQDGSRVTGKLLKKVDVEPDTAVAWLLLEAVAHHGNGVFANSHFIQRVKTRGGLPPVSGCDSNHLGIEKAVPYAADYLYYQ